MKLRIPPPSKKAALPWKWNQDPPKQEQTKRWIVTPFLGNLSGLKVFFFPCHEAPAKDSVPWLQFYELIQGLNPLVPRLPSWQLILFLPNTLLKMIILRDMLVRWRVVVSFLIGWQMNSMMRETFFPMDVCEAARVCSRSWERVKSSFTWIWGLMGAQFFQPNS